MTKEDKYRELLIIQEDSGIGIRAFCHNQGIATATFYYWRKKLMKNKGHDFIPLLRQQSHGISTIPIRNSRSISESHQHEPLSMELQYPNGVVLRIKSDMDLRSLQALIQLQD